MAVIKWEGHFRIEGMHSSPLHFVHRLNTVLLGLVVVLMIIMITILSSYFVLSSYKGPGLCMCCF